MQSNNDQGNNINNKNFGSNNGWWQFDVMKYIDRWHHDNRRRLWQKEIVKFLNQLKELWIERLMKMTNTMYQHIKCSE